MGPGDVGLDYTIQYRRRVRCACLLSMTHGPGLDSMLGGGGFSWGAIEATQANMRQKSTSRTVL